VAGQAFDAVVIATSSTVAAQLLQANEAFMPKDMLALARQWTATTQALQFESITTVYAYAADARLSQPMVALPNSAEHPAQFVFDRGQLGGQKGILAFVVSASNADRAVLQKQVIHQAQQQLGLTLEAIQTVVEKRATFACTPGLQRPSQNIMPNLVACGDYIDGPYPATLEGAVRSGIHAINELLK
jgi:predicted NAD/FAD-dependent oxidoreductase